MEGWINLLKHNKRVFKTLANWTKVLLIEQLNNYIPSFTWEEEP